MFEPHPSNFEILYNFLTCLTLLIHTSVLPSIWNPGKIFAPIGHLGQAHTLQIYTAGIGTHVKSVKVTSICHRYYHVKV